MTGTKLQQARTAKTAHQEADEAEVGVAVAKTAQVEDADQRVRAGRQLRQRALQQVHAQPLAVVQRKFLCNTTALRTVSTLLLNIRSLAGHTPAGHIAGARSTADIGARSPRSLHRDNSMGARFSRGQHAAHL